MKKLLVLAAMMLPLAGCSASVGTPATTTTTTYAAPATVHRTTVHRAHRAHSRTMVTPVVTETTVTKSNY